MTAGGVPAPRWPWGTKMLPPVSGSSAVPAAGPGAGAAGTGGHPSPPQPNHTIPTGKPTDRAPQCWSRMGMGGVTDLRKRRLSNFWNQVVGVARVAQPGHSQPSI